MTGDTRTQVILAAGGLGTRVQPWSRYLPKEFQPVDGRPGIVHILEEIAQLGPTRAVIIYHPYYEAFVAWTRHVLRPQALDEYLQAAGRCAQSHEPASELQVDFVAQRGPYADLTSIINGADHFANSNAAGGGAGDLYVAFCDNLYPTAHPLLALRDLPYGVAVLARPYQSELAGQRGVVIVTAEASGHRRMIGLVEKPTNRQARHLEQTHGTANLLLLEGRARVTADFVTFARRHREPGLHEPKLALTLNAYARSNRILVLTTTDHVIDLGGGEPGTAVLAPAERDLRRENGTMSGGSRCAPSW